jgi:hypothetical protein
LGLRFRPAPRTWRFSPTRHRFQAQRKARRHRAATAIPSYLENVEFRMLFWRHF